MTKQEWYNFFDDIVYPEVDISTGKVGQKIGRYIPHNLSDFGKDIILAMFMQLYTVDNSYAPLAQLDRALVYGTKGRAFESLTAHQTKTLTFS